MNWKDNINVIHEVYPGHYRIILDFATIAILKYLLNNDYKYVWVYEHTLDRNFEWESHSIPLGLGQNHQLMIRNVTFDFVMPTVEFKEKLSLFKGSISMAQVNELPKPYLIPSNITGKTRYELLKNECDYLFELEIPSATDYGVLMSPNREWLQSLLDNEGIDWGNLP
jgi:hypothetical protein